MSIVIKGMIRITNDRQLLSSLPILIIALTATGRLIKRNPRVGMQAYCPNYCTEGFLDQNLKPFSEKKL